MPRLFVAIGLGHAVEEALLGQMERLRESCRGWRWVQREHLHVTLKFLGEIEVVVVGAVERALGGVEFEPFAMQVAGLGVFPDRRRPRVLWAGVGEGDARVAELAGRIDRALRGAGIPRETRPFTPHVTLARTRRGERPQVPAGVGGLELEFGRTRVGEFVLVESRLDPGGAAYSVRARFPGREP
jgi:2'-5' RNA ligase